MNVSYEWLHDYCDFDLGPEELADQLSRRGIEVDSLARVGDDWCLDLEITANRPDLLCHIGVAREIAAFTSVPLRIPSVELREEAKPASQLARVEVHHPELCPRYAARILYDVEVGPAPPEMQRRLEAIGLRPVNNVVDITNYVLMECGQPEHAFDFARLNGKVVIVRPAERGEMITLIDGTQLELAPEHLVIADATHAIALAGIMGGLETEIGDSTDVVLLESAKFDPVSIRRTSRTTGKTSDSSYRFERSVDTPTVEWASRRAAALMQRHANARLAAGVIDVNFTHEEPRTVTLRIPRIAKVLGVGIRATEAGRLLKGIGFGVKAEGHDVLTVAVPSFRPDVALEIDLIEEVARCHGYDRVPETSGMRIGAVADSKFDKVATLARQTLLRLGYHEAVTTSFLGEELARRFAPWNSEEPVCVQNPLRADEAALRRSLVPALLRVQQANQAHGVGEVAVFELNRVYLRRSVSQRLPEEKHCLAALADQDFRHLKGAAEAVFEQLALADRVTLEPAAYDFLAPGASAAWRLGSGVVGYVGQVADEAAALFDLRRTPCVCELDVDALVAAATLERRFRDLPRFPAIPRDIALVVDEATTWEEILGAIGRTDAEHLESVQFGEIYRGKQVPYGKKSVLFSLVFRAPDRTLTHDEANASQDRLLAALGEQLGATLRA
jgi:phenylalanyl-tRNA synthetase beta chain